MAFFKSLLRPYRRPTFCRADRPQMTRLVTGAVTEVLERRWMLATSTVSERVSDYGPGNASSTGSVSDGTYAYYWGRAQDAPDGANVLGIWKTDGTAAGTTELGTVTQSGWFQPSNFTLANGRLFFTAAESNNDGAELYIADSGGVRSADLTGAGTHWYVSAVAELNGRVHAISSPPRGAGNHGLYSTDGGPAQ